MGPKSQQFSYLGMIARSQFAALDFNAGSGLEHATTIDREKVTTQVFLKSLVHGHVNLLKIERLFLFARYD